MRAAQPPALFGDYGHQFLRRFGACVRLLQRHDPEPARISAIAGRQAASSGCRSAALAIHARRPRPSGRARSPIARVRRAHPRLEADCVKAADGTLVITVGARRPSTPLRKLVGRRLQMAVGRARSARRGRSRDRLAVTWHTTAR
jgi:hypothetical protein